MKKDPQSARDTVPYIYSPTFAECREIPEVIQFVVIALSAFLVESWVIKLFLEDTFAAWQAAAAHCVITGLISAWVFQQHRQGHGKRLPFLMALSTAVLGPFGSAGALLTMILYCFFRRNATPFQEWHSALFPKIQIPKNQELFDRLSSNYIDRLDSNSVIPFIDVLQYGTKRQKQIMIVLLVNNFRGKFAPVLKEALASDDSSVRVLAAMGMAEVDNKFMQRNMKMEKLKEKKGSDPKFLKALGQHYDDYVYSGILDSIREQEYRDLAIDAYSEYLQLNPSDLEMYFIIGRMLLRNGKIVEAAAKFKEALQKDKDSKKILFWYLECLYRLGRFGELRELAATHFEKFRDTENLPFDSFKVIQLWAPSRMDPVQQS